MRNATGARLLIADDDESVREAYASLLRDFDGIASVLGAADGVEALKIGAAMPLDVAIVDLNMPRLDGVATAIRLAALLPTIAIALHSSDPAQLQWRARELDFALFDKVDFDGLAEWLVRELKRRLHAAAEQRDSKCLRCGYGIAVVPPPERCPICNMIGDWTYAHEALNEVTA